MATIWSTVLILPPLLAGMTPCLITQKRSSVTPTSRTMMTLVTHQVSAPSADSVIRADPVSALSAMGSAILPKSVILPPRLASSPSRRSVTDATPNTTKAAVRDAVPLLTSSTTNTGTRASLSNVSPFGTLIRLGLVDGPPGSVLVKVLRRSVTRLPQRLDELRHQVHPLRA